MKRKERVSKILMCIKGVLVSIQEGKNKDWIYLPNETTKGANKNIWNTRFQDTGYQAIRDNDV